MEFRRITSLPPYVFTIIDSLKTEARRGGVPYDDVVDLIDEIWKEMGS